ncbi:SpoIIE family protein phosphatase [Streptomyces sp. NBC_00094]|uniref:SpoIIE family protein phosphatase n=1 Tax=Streptomyces sp. NBC_00094 TaxID=2903620 RepID=UPI00224F78EC|nr:SpoIIE family protein phosphatase [Streptomyces sp. NBC_00094]MCX5388807.1 SpoIIE family protein phosphatase [Streptomyces sp. NBC_00094]
MAPDNALLVVDAAGVVVGWSQEARSLFDRGTSEAIGRPLADLWPGSGTPSVAGPSDATTELPGLLVLPVTLRGGGSGWSVHLRRSDKDEEARDQALLNALFTQSPIGMQVLDPELRVLRVNTAASAMSRIGSARVLGHRLDDAFRLSDPTAAEAIVREVLATGEPALDRLIRVRPPEDPDHEHVYSASVFRLQDADGRVLGVSTAVVDVTVRERALARARVLDSVREHVGTTLDLNATCAELVDVLVPAFADTAVIDLLDPVVRGDAPPSAPIGPDTPLRRTAFASTDHRRDAPAGGTGPFRFPGAWLQSLTDLRPHLVTYHPDDDPDADPRPTRTTRPSGAHSAIVTPLTIRDQVLGTLSLHRASGRDLFVDEDLTLAWEVATRTALHIDNARRYTREHTIALTLQRRLLPQRPAHEAAVESAHFAQAVEAGGGWFDVFPLSGGRTALTVGCVSGTGIHAAMAMGQIRTALHSLASLDLEPDELLARLDETVTRLAAERADLPSGDPLRSQVLTADCLYAVYDPLALNCVIALAGGPRPVLAHPDGTTETVGITPGPPLGGGEGAPLASLSLDLSEGSVIALCTDAFLSVSESGRAAGLERLRQALADGGRPLDDLCADAVRTVPAPSPGADAVLLLVRTQGMDPGLVATWDLPSVPEAVAIARAATRRQLTAWGLDELSLATELIVSELATNAVRYGTPPLTIRLIKGRALTCEVSDTSPVAPRLRHARTHDEGGRGLFICAELSQSWGVRYGDAGKTIWTEQEIPDPA